MTSFQVFSSSALACNCIADPYSKKYIYYKKTWYGTKRKWTCEYKCQDLRQQQTIVVGTHEDWYVSDKGLEGICDGLHYVNRYNNYVQDFVWALEEARYFDASESTAAELKKWNSESCR
ncbi:MAG: hypothetical protein OM95_09695 [Bdellovibrio sp. ArHS]|nr:MAG: hypothetical protein OM95_09695 [Bdellovibrio sp. ArHS]